MVACSSLRILRRLHLSQQRLQLGVQRVLAKALRRRLERAAQVHARRGQLPRGPRLQQG